jgi:hypothetical protein
VKQIRSRLTYANVMATIAVFLVLGGATALAAGLAKNSVGSKQLKKNSVTAAKIKKNAVTGAKIKNGTITGTKINLGSLGTVPSATNATNAGNANTVGGMHVGKLQFSSGINTAKTSIFSANGLTLFASCNGSEELELTATSSVPHSEIYESGNYLSTYNGGFDDDFNPGDIEAVGDKIADSSQNEVQGQLVFATPSGAQVTAQFLLDGFGSFGNTTTCAVEGTVNYS